MLFRIITWMFVIGILFRLFSRYILPVFRMTSAASSQMRQMQEKMREMDQKMNQPAPAPAKKVKKEGDYIDYEEIS